MSFTDEEVAMVIHAANMEVQRITNDMGPSVIWWYEHDEIKNTTINGVQLVRYQQYGPEELHKAWMVRKMDDGWTLGEIKDLEKKTHPCLVEWADLPDHQKAKNFMFVNIVLALS